ncbi:substrate-binding domain-containing protein [Kitasatospora sp. MAP5-34]|uniref:substrate-binding domain-containing protein n=1 Tax=Kitasatospora sp. MAP5-34 TaxID=3035102 RepID=UPI002472EFAD|nr:substrate-binding domain-containing protein [Kitasatospora sp. MAP5-34]MDH6579931.1 ABC-type phosphate transport system substrate-binding protein [Kitasatospora sp. MAP5-34]
MSRTTTGIRHFARPLAVLLCALAVLLVQSPAASASTSLNGDGSSWAGPALDQWRQDVGPQGIDINFSPVGSAAGRQQWSIGQDDFTASDVPFRSGTDAGAPGGGGQPENPVYDFSYVPVTAGGTAFMYHLTVGGQLVRNLRLSSDTIVKIFTGRIGYWDDQAIKKDYGGTLPHTPITPVVRSDGSGATAQFTRYMEHTHQAEWDAYCKAQVGSSCGDYTEFFPPSSHMVAQNGSDVVANYIQSPTGEGTIGYDEYAFAKRANWPVVKVLNAAGYYTLPTASNVAVALTAAKIKGVDDSTPPGDPNYLQQDLDGVYTMGDPRAYPISSYSYLIVPRGGESRGIPPRFTTAKGAALSQYIGYILCAGQGEADQLGYSPIPRGLVRGGLLQVSHVPGNNDGIDPNQLGNCPNPTFDSSGRLVVLTNAPQPSPCDQAGQPLTCTVQGGRPTSGGSAGGGSGGGGSGGGGTGRGAGPASGGTGGTGGAATGGTGGAAAGGGGGASGGSGTTTVDPQTGQIVSANGTGAGTAVPASVVALSGRHDDRLLTTLTALELLAVVAVPPFLGSYLRRRRGQGTEQEELQP